MFYLELKDGEKIFTGAEDDDYAAYRKIIEDKLGKDALTLFEKLYYFTDGKHKEIHNRSRAYEQAFLKIWSITKERDKDYSDSDKVKDICRVIENTINVIIQS